MARLANTYSRLRSAALALTFAVGALTLAGCSALNAHDLIEDSENARHSAFQAFRDHRYGDAIERYKVALNKAQAAGNNDRLVAMTMNDIGRCAAATNDMKTAQNWFQQAVALQSTNGGKDRDSAIPYAESLEALATTDEALGQKVDAEKLFGQALALSQKYNLARARNIVYEYKSFLFKNGRQEDAASLANEQKAVSSQQALPDRLERQREEYRTAMRTGDGARDSNDLATAENEYVSALRVAHDLNDENYMGDAASKLASVYRRAGRLPEAEKSERFCLEKFKAIASPKFPIELAGLAEILREEGKLQEALAAAHASVNMVDKTNPQNQEELMLPLGTVVMTSMTAGNWDDAIEAQRRVYDIEEKLHPITSPSVVMPACYVANMCFMGKQDARGEQWIGRYLRKLDRAPAGELALTARLFNDFADSCLKDGHKDVARKFYTASLAMLKRLPTEHAQIERANRQLKKC